MKARFALAALMTIATAPLAAQGMRGGQQMNVDNMTTLYSLSPEQKTMTEALIATYTESTKGVTAWMMKLRESGADMQAIRSTPGFADSTKKSTDARAKFDADFKAILIGTQVAKFDSVAAARAARMRPQG